MVHSLPLDASVDDYELEILMANLYKVQHQSEEGLGSFLGERFYAFVCKKFDLDKNTKRTAQELQKIRDHLTELDFEAGQACIPIQYFNEFVEKDLKPHIVEKFCEADESIPRNKLFEISSYIFALDENMTEEEIAEEKEAMETEFYDELTEGNDKLYFDNYWDVMGSMIIEAAFLGDDDSYDDIGDDYED
eukprot:TRINITY_DN3203_c0_g1_i1.p1 TRINITY_DN3203_c0_g1~~TRINITY_DN3203_c0_g1_i1.p1  ORF type:complete len:191 (-),score=71.01 TRINITY_DN3203_c0_g1_i1:280-852(-)